MHPEVVRAEPGTCPNCWMALDLRTVTFENAPKPELWTRPGASGRASG
ncbi:hypothetical protein WMF30_09470 [Sorangium sp. So ce134]